MTVFSVPINLPFWYQPCGSKIEPDNYNLNNIEHEIKSSLNRMKLQHGIALGSFKKGNYENNYDKAGNHIARKQYIPHWIPNEHDISLIKQLEGKTLRTVADHLPGLHTDLQKFSIAIEEMINDENDLSKKNALERTLMFLQSYLCEVETTIVNLSFLNIPERISRNIMVQKERDPEDYTRRLVRDWGILIKYKEHLIAWKKVLDSH
ncbi:uncharacterized protein LOC122849380 [Aphidius gifuensis]|uniref:uncharacterized protein LOC122849380 n=1 Tax=Aphidius gifuensis TaxID=684658 RepID=UPI001CDBB00D|nr:uncharacterized protein LOC122849380 [Aphidius gifuensis]